MYYYPKQWSSASPGLLIFLVDQSTPNTNVYNNSFNPSQFCANFVNYQINKLIAYHFNGCAPKNRCYIEVIGYSDDATILCSGFLKELYESPAKVNIVRKSISDGAGGFVEIDKSTPIWIEPIKEGENSNTASAFLLALNTIQNWLEKYPDSPAPIIVNISHKLPKIPFLDDEKAIEESIKITNEIKELGAVNEKTLILSLINSSADILNIYELSDNKIKYKNYLKAVSSIIPEYYEWLFERRNINFNKIKRGIFLIDDFPELQQMIIYNNDIAEEIVIKGNQYNN